MRRMLEYRNLKLEEAERIAEIDATHYIKNVCKANSRVWCGEIIFVCRGCREYHCVL